MSMRAADVNRSCAPSLFSLGGVIILVDLDIRVLRVAFDRAIHARRCPL